MSTAASVSVPPSAMGTAPSSPPTPTQNSGLTLNWTQPTENSDGTPIASGELAGYKIVFGSSATQLDQNVAITDPTVTTYTFQNLPSGTWYFALISIDSAGNESAPTNVVSATI